MSELSRRDFLKLIRNGSLYVSGALIAAGLFRFFNDESQEKAQREFDLGPSANYLFNSRTVLSEPAAVILHNENGLSAFSLVCTHLGCTVESNGTGYACPCHGSRFDANGMVLQGPARKQLQALRVEITEQGNLITEKPLHYRNFVPNLTVTFTNHQMIGDNCEKTYANPYLRQPLARLYPFNCPF